jgi:hypothetical protein
MRQKVYFRPRFDDNQPGEVEIVHAVSTKSEDRVPPMFMVRYLDNVCKPVLAFADELFIETKEGESWET